MSRRHHFAGCQVAAALVLVAGAVRSQSPTLDLDRFRALDPAERLKTVEALPNAKTAFTKVARGNLNVLITERGSAEAANIAELGCELTARDKNGFASGIKWLVAEGSAVKKGEKLVELDDSAIRDEIKATKDAARVKELEAELEKCVIKAPMEGIAVYVQPPRGRVGGAAGIVAVGEPVKEGQKLVQVVDLRKMLIVTNVGEAAVASVRVGQVVHVQVDAFAGKPVAGKVARVSANPAGNGRAGARVYPVTVALDEPLDGLKPGMSADVRISIGERKNVLLAPQGAVRFGRNGSYCFVKEGDKLVEREVKTGGTDGTNIEITDGLKEGDTILADPAAVLGKPKERGR
jgi:multidrug efflux pump subunit AcrA (membrane-fusion protein)